MRILMKIGEFDRDDRTPEELATTLFNRASDAYNDQTDVGSAYLKGPDEGDVIGDLEFVDGSADRDAIANLAAGWNREIEDEFTRSMNALSSEVEPDGNGRIAWLSAKSLTIYAVKMAAMALDGDFYAFAEKALLINDNGCFGTTLTDQERDDILAHPDNYAAITVYPK